jgi:hypothetical protein
MEPSDDSRSWLLGSLRLASHSQSQAAWSAAAAVRQSVIRDSIWSMTWIDTLWRNTIARPNLSHRVIVLEFSRSDVLIPHRGMR